MNEIQQETMEVILELMEKSQRNTSIVRNFCQDCDADSIQELPEDDGMRLIGLINPSRLHELKQSRAKALEEYRDRRTKDRLEEFLVDNVSKYTIVIDNPNVKLLLKKCSKDVHYRKESDFTFSTNVIAEVHFIGIILPLVRLIDLSHDETKILDALRADGIKVIPFTYFENMRNELEKA